MKRPVKVARATRIDPRVVELHRQVAIAIAPAFVAEFLTGGDAWADYEDVAESIEKCSAAIARRLA